MFSFSSLIIFFQFLYFACYLSVKSWIWCACLLHFSSRIDFSVLSTSRSSFILFIYSSKSSLSLLIFSPFSFKALSLCCCLSKSRILSSFSLISSLARWICYLCKWFCLSCICSRFLWCCCYSSYFCCSCSDRSSFILRPCSINSFLNEASFCSFYARYYSFCVISFKSPLHN